MIQVNVKKSKHEDRILHITVKGHADYNQPGKDIVCSAVSALTIGAVNSVEKLLNIDLEPKQNKKDGGYLSWQIIKLDDPHTDSQLQLLMKALIESLMMIEEQYKHYIQINIETSQ